MKTNLVAYGFSSLLGTTIFAQAIDPASVTSYKDLTVTGLLLVAVVYLYRELRADRKETKEFITTQTAVMTDASKAQVVASGKVAEALTKLTTASEQQVEIYRAHINDLVNQAKKGGHKRG